MTSNTKIGLGVLGAVAAVFAGTKLLGLSALNSHLDISQSLGTVTGLSLTGVTLPINLTLKNPTLGTITVKQPYLALYFNGSQIGTSTVQNQDYLVPQFGQVELPPVQLVVSPVSGGLAVLSFLKTLIQRKQDGGPVTVEVVSRTLIDGQIPYEKRDTLPLSFN